jgi:hypothetical protein
MRLIVYCLFTPIFLSLLGCGGGSESTTSPPQNITVPTISLNGENIIVIDIGSTYSDAGATGQDSADGNISSNIVIGGDNVDTSTIGTYVVTYNASNSSGTPASEVKRYISVQTTYYVDSLSGDNTFDGKSEANAWATIDRVNRGMRGAELNVEQIPLGSDVLFKRGETFQDKDLRIKHGGNQYNPMIIGAYGESSSPKPIFTGVAYISSSDALIGHITVQDIELNNITSGTAIIFSREHLTNVTLSRLDIHYPSRNAIYLTSIDGYIIEDCTISNTGLGGIVIYGDHDDSWYKISNGIIRNNTVTNTSQTSGDGITLHRSSEGHNIGPNHLLEYNDVSYNGENAYDITAGSNITLRHNKGYQSNNHEISIGHDADGVLIDSCHFYDSNGGGINIGGDSHRVTVVNTVIENVARRAIVIGDSNGTSRPVIDTKILNNTIYNTSTYEAVRIESGVDYLEYKNNIVEATQNSRYIFYSSTLTPTNTHSNFSNNIWNRPNGNGNSFGYIAITASTLDFTDWLGSYSQGVDSLLIDPALTDATNGDFSLTIDSPARDAGTATDTSQDFIDTYRPQNTLFDIGAYEYVTD